MIRTVIIIMMLIMIRIMIIRHCHQTNSNSNDNFPEKQILSHREMPYLIVQLWG